MSSRTFPPRVVVIVLNWNRALDTLECLESVGRLEYGDYRTVVVDNGSTDGSVEAIRDKFPGVTIIENEINLGYAAGNNVGIQYALRNGADYVVLLNNDTVVDPQFVSELVDMAESDTKIGAVGPKALNYEDPARIWAAYGWLRYKNALVQVEGMFGNKHRSEYSEVLDVDWVVGCGIMMRAEALETVGLLDESYFAYYDEVDWCLRAKQRGYRIVYVPASILWHKGHSSTAEHERKQQVSPIEYFKGRNTILFARKHANYRQWAKLLACLSGRLAVEFVYGLVRGESKKVALRVRGIRDGFKGYDPPLEELNLR